MSPFPETKGLPYRWPWKLRKLRKLIIKAMADQGIKESTIRPFFPSDLAGKPAKGESTCIYIRLDTGMYFGDEKSAEKEMKVTNAVAQVVFDFFKGKYAVEVFIGGLNPHTKKHIKPKN